jgi:hypothetical protein
VSLGHTATTYTGWSHVYAQSGYSIWKYSPTSYEYNAVNQLYCDDRIYENRGLADSESATTFTKVYMYNGSTYTDNTTEAGTESGTSFNLMSATNHYLYCGSSTKFGGISFEFDTRGSNYTLDVEYYNGSYWSDVEKSGTIYGDDTSNFESDGIIYFETSALSNWKLGTVNSQSLYWIRISTTTIPTTVATGFYIYPANSAVGLLQLSNTEILNEDWAWCSYGTAIYVTIRNDGASAYEGDAYLKSSSSSMNKQNYFTSNHEFKIDYEDSSFD